MLPCKPLHHYITTISDWSGVGMCADHMFDALTRLACCEESSSTKAFKSFVSNAFVVERHRSKKTSAQNVSQSEEQN